MSRYRDGMDNNEAPGRVSSEQPRDLMKALRESLEVATGRSLSSTEEAAMSGERHLPEHQDTPADARHLTNCMAGACCPDCPASAAASHGHPGEVCAPGSRGIGSCAHHEARRTMPDAGRSSTGHPNHQPDTSKPLDATEGACTCGYVGRAEYVSAHIARCAAWWTERDPSDDARRWVQS